MIVTKHKCPLLKPQYQIIKIHYRPHKTLVTAQEVDISLKKTLNCSIACPLGIGILEYIHNNSWGKIHYHEWGGVYRVTWQIIAAKSRGYSITVNSTCAACAQLCDVAIAIGLPHAINKVMFNTYKIYSKDSHGYDHDT